MDSFAGNAAFGNFLGPFIHPLTHWLTCFQWLRSLPLPGHGMFHKLHGCCQMTSLLPHYTEHHAWWLHQKPITSYTARYPCTVMVRITSCLEVTSALPPPENFAFIGIGLPIVRGVPGHRQRLLCLLRQQDTSAQIIVYLHQMRHGASVW